MLGYANTLRNGFVWDDSRQILQNPNLRAGTAWLNLFSSDVWAFTHPGEQSRNNYYRPLQMLTYRTTAQLFDFDAVAFHAVNLVFHLLATLLAYAVLFELTRRVALALPAAALFAVHPIHTEAVAWASALTELGCAVFFFLSFYLFLVAEPASASGDQPRRWLRGPKPRILSWTSFALALLWKEMALTLPMVIACYLVLCGDESFWVRWRKACWRVLPYGAVVVAYLIVRHHALGFLYTSQRRWVLPLSDYVLTAAYFVAKYWWKLLLPIQLNAYHVFDPVRSLTDPRALAAILFLIVAAAGIAYSVRRAPLAAFAASWVFLTLIPVLNLRGVGRNVFAERYLYIPSLGSCLLLVWLVNKGLARLAPAPSTWLGGCALALLLGVFVAQTVRRNADWTNEFTLFSQTAKASPNSPDMQNAVAELIRSQGNDLDAAERHYQQAVSLAQQQDPPEWDQIDSAYLGLALIYSQQGHLDKALDALSRARAADPTDAGVRSAVGGVLLQAGRWKEAKEALRQALESNPSDENALNGLGIIAWQDEHQYDRAVEYFQQALRAHATSDRFASSVQNNLGAVYCEMDRCSEAIEHFQRALELSPTDPEYHTNLGNAFGALGQFAEARAEFEKALMLAPGYAPANASLSNLDKRERPRR
ncbi:MAG TPA: tetratricopeptide repeat protein [Terriglobales bacterium]|nr:tetratricopeptide repeat protein [Terriglobales bacterium]